MNTSLAQKEQKAAQSQREGQPERVSVVPAVNVFETKDGYVLQAEMPGVNKEGLSISLEGNELTIVGRRRAEEGTAGQVLYRESRPADFRRVFELDPTVETSKINARIEQGILTLTLPKAERVKPRKIAVS